MIDRNIQNEENKEHTIKNQFTMRRKQIILFIFSLLLINSVIAQENLSLSVEEAKQYALDFNKTVKNAELSVQQSQESIKETIASGLPQVDATVDYSKQMGKDISVDFGGSDLTIPLKPSSNFNLQLTQLIFSGSYIVGIKSAKLYERLSEQNREKTEIDIVSDVVENYYLSLMADESLKILEANLKNLQTVYNKTKPMVSVGMKEKVELDQLAVQVNSLKNAVSSAKRQCELTKNMLRLQLGVSADTEIELTETLDKLIEDAHFTQSNTIGDFDLNANVDYQILGMQEQLNQKQVDLQKTAYMPTVSGYYTYTYKIMKPAFDMSPPHVIGFQMNIPIFSGGERRSKVTQAKFDLQTAKNNREQMGDQLSIQYKQLSFNLLNAVEKYETQTENVKVSREVYKSLKTKFEQGVISSLELTTADNNYLSAESDYLSAKVEALRAKNDLETLTGEVYNQKKQ